MSDNGQHKCYFFGDFVLDPQRRLLSKNGCPISLKPRSVELLIALVEEHGRTVSKTELLDRVWKDHFVDEKNLSVHVAALRKAFGEGKGDNQYIATLSGTGYSFVAKVRVADLTSAGSESVSFRRVVIEEEFEDDRSLENYPAATAPAKMSKIEAGMTGRFGYPVLLLIVVVAMFGGGSVWLLNRVRSGNANVAARSTLFNELKIKKLTTSGKVLRAGMSSDAKLYAYVVGDGDKQSLWVAEVTIFNSVLRKTAFTRHRHFRRTGRASITAYILVSSVVLPCIESRFWAAYPRRYSMMSKIRSAYHPEATDLPLLG